MAIFRVNADYRFPQKHPNYYYVNAVTKAEAKRKFARKISWLKIISVEECSEADAMYVVSHPMNYIVF